MPAATKNNAICARWEATLARSGDRPAILGPDGAVLRTFSAVEREANDCAARLEKFEPRSVLAIQIGNSPSWPALLLAAFRCELIPLPLGRHIEKTERDAALTTCGAMGVVETGENGFQFVHRDGPRPNWNGKPPDFLKLTSGTTSAPRAICFHADQLAADCDNICETMGIAGEDVNFGVIPFSHSYGFSNLLTPLLCRGIALVASEDRMPRAILLGLAQSRATVFPGMPVFFEKLSDLENAPALPALRLCISAGAPLSRRIAGRFSERFDLKVHTFYGSSECGGIGYDASEALDYEEGFAGAPMRNVQVTPLDALDASRIEVRSDAVGECYFPEDDPKTLGARRFIPGDLIRMSPRGLHLVGRVSDIINIAGRKLNPAEVEARLTGLPGVKQAVVFGIPSPLRHEEAIACVVGDVSATAVLRFARTVLSPWQVPKAVWIAKEIPVNERGKFSRRELARLYLESH
ncbi:MAG: long-chain acyl-CoA synthetase [Chthoniobacter sp.]|jgi:long-chain acyl-CoA synthetase|nr:long-chain acyl-CoA synthetase [Chthoniobacter sp.]